MDFTNSVSKNIEKLVGTLKSDEQLQEILKKKFTKKEYKVFVAFEEGKSLDEVKKLMNDDEDRIKEIHKASIKKLNQEKIKKELVSIK